MATWSAPYELRKLEVHFTRTPTLGVAQDDDICTFHFLNLTAGAPDSTWTTTDYTQIETAADTWWNALKPDWPAEVKLSEYLWRADGPAFRPHGTSFSPTLRVTARSLAGATAESASAKMLPPQCAISVTEVTDAKYVVTGVGVPGSGPGGKTQQRNRWGRFYLPPATSGSLTDGRWATALLTSIADKTQTFYNSCVTNQLIPVMYSPTTGSAWSITEIHVDDIVDVVRSRRYITPTTRTPRIINAA
jgi:hypothetical protein